VVNALLKATYSTRSRGSQPAECSTVGLDADPVVDGISEMLLAAKIPLGCLHGDVPKQKLDLVQFTSSIAAQSSASPSEVVRGKFFNGCFFGAVLHDMPHNPLRDTIPPSLACAANAPKDTTIANTSRDKPRIDCAFYPIWNGHRSYVPAFADQIDDSPVIFPPLEMSNVQASCLFPAQPATEKDAEERPVSFALKSVRVRHLAERLRLLHRQPVAQTNAEVLRPFNSLDASSKIGRQ
jgi:hypothetical protein